MPEVSRNVSSPLARAKSGVNALSGPADAPAPKSELGAAARDVGAFADKVGDKAKQVKAAANAVRDPIGVLGPALAKKLGLDQKAAQLAQQLGVTAFVAKYGPQLAALAEKYDPDTVLAQLTNPLSALLPAFPAATQFNIALGIPHAHIGHPPSGPPPIPPTPLPPLGPVVFGTCATVLINGKPAARCGDIGLSPTCCALPYTSLYEILTGSSKVFIGGSRAARALLDITLHCKSVPPAGKAAGAMAKAGKAASCASKFAKVKKIVCTTKSIAGKVADAADAVSTAADRASTVATVAAAAIEGDAETVEAAGNAIADAIAMAMSAAMGKDQPMVPPTGTPGMILMGSPNVLIGGLPLPSTSAIAGGLLKKLKVPSPGSIIAKIVGPFG